MGKLRYLGQFVLNSFVQLAKIKQGTPAFDEYVSFIITRHKNTLRKQLFLQNHGVSFSYTDTLSYKQLEDLIDVCRELDDEMQEQLN